ncbi:MAG: hypothetical protein HUJ61_03255, partial [Bacilli bacterium]|nr:hypothetical protein [Bacilli bacterium]
KNNLINTEFVAHSEIEKDNIFSDLNESLKNADIRNDYLYLVQFIGHTSSSNGDSKKIESFTYKVVYSPIFAGIGSLDNVKDGSSLYSYEFNYTIDYIEGVNYYWFLIWWSKPYKEITSNFNYDTTYELLEYSLGTSKDKRIISTEKRD